MKKITLYSLLILLSACGTDQKKNDSETLLSEKATDTTTRNTCFCDVDDNLNLISDSVRDAGMELWNHKIASLFPTAPATELPKGFQISISDMRSLANLLNIEKNPPITDMMGYFMFKSQNAADSGRISVVFVPHYTDTTFLTCPDCKNHVGAQKSQNINVDLTNPCPPACNQ